MSLPPIKADQDSFSAWYLQPTGSDPGDALGFFGAATPGERSSLIRRGYVLLGDVQGDMGNPEEPLMIRPPTLAKCTWLLGELRKRVRPGQAKLQELLDEAVAASTDVGLPMSERQIYRERTVGLRAKLQEIWRVSPPSASERKRMVAEAKRLEGVAADKDLLDDERREARDGARRLRQQLKDLPQLRPYTPAGLRQYFLMAYRVQMVNRVPKPYWETQQLINQIASIQAEERDLITQSAEQQAALMEGVEEEVESEPESVAAGEGGKK